MARAQASDIHCLECLTTKPRVEKRVSSEIVSSTCSECGHEFWSREFGKLYPRVDPKRLEVFAEEAKSILRRMLINGCP